MRNNLYVLLSLIVGLGVMSCSTKHNASTKAPHYATLNKEQIKPFEESGIKLSYDIICLDSTTQALLSNVNQVEIAPNRILVYSFLEGVLIFNSNGEYVNSIAKGRAPNEIMQVNDVLYNSADNCFEILDFQNKLKVFDLNGNYVRTKIDLGNRYSDDFIRLNDIYLFQTTSQDYTYYLINSDKKTFKETLHLTKLIKVKDYNIINNPFATHNDTIFCYHPGDDIIYSLSQSNSETFEPYIQLEGLFKWGMNVDLTYTQLQDYCKTNNVASKIQEFNILNENIWQMTFITGTEVYNIFLDRKNNLLYHEPIFSKIPYLGITVGTHLKGNINAIPFIEAIALEESNNYTLLENQIIRDIKAKCAEMNYKNIDEGNYIIIKFNYN